VTKSDDASLHFSDILTPHRKYLWEIYQGSKNLASIEQSGLLTSKDKVGKIEIVVTDQDIKTNQDVKEVLVVEPFSLNL